MSVKPKQNTVSEMLSGLRKGFQHLNKINEDGTEEPFRADLYSSSQLNEHAKILAGKHKLLHYRIPDTLLKRLDENEQKLVEVRNVLVASIRAEKTIAPAAEWLLDNFYLIEEQVLLARKHLPKGYSEALPYLVNSISNSMPRVYEIVLEIIAHSDGRVDAKGLSGYIAAYQTVSTLTLGELWAIPIMLRIAVIENLRRVSSRLALDMMDHDLADFWADKMIIAAKENSTNLIFVIAEMLRSEPEFNSSFVAGFTRKLQGLGQTLALPLSLIEDYLVSQNTTSGDFVNEESHKQAADQASVSNSIGTLRFIGNNNWSEFVETLSSVEQVLRKDFSGAYPLMDFVTRDRYRHVVENVAKTTKLSETEVADAAIKLSQEQAGNKDHERYAHVGYFLIDKGIKQLEEVVDSKETRSKKLVKLISAKPVIFYLLFILLGTVGFFAVMWAVGLNQGSAPILYTCLAAVFALAGAAHLSISLVNWMATIVVKPRLLPRMDFSKNIPPECRTLIVVPTMLSSMAYIDELLEALEIRYLANNDAHLHYGLLTDFTDADKEILPEDASLVGYAEQRITELNFKYKPAERDVFFLFHRPRTWNAKEGAWMGYERKRGKLAALNALLRDRHNDEFSKVCGRKDILNRIKYVITLDSDTQLPREAAWKFIATMSHPLNHAVYNTKLRRVVEGYGIMQPRMASSLPRGKKSLYLRMQGDALGIDPYTHASSDVYQDLFNEGSFIGKGIYDVDVFEQALEGVFEEHRILSHDLLEGCYVRSGLISDVLLYEENTAQYAIDMKRQHRWVRGDWQIGAWMLPFVTNAGGKLTRNKLSLLSRWKIFDNLRRSLLPLSLLLLLILGWTVLPLSWFWTLTVSLLLTLQVMVGAGWQLLHKPAELKLRSHLLVTGISVRDILLRFIFNIAVLPFEAYRFADAIIRTNYRMIISKRKLLEWTPSAALSTKSYNSLTGAYKAMWIGPLVGLITALLIIVFNPYSIFVAAPILLLWVLAPAIVLKLSIPEKKVLPDLTTDQYLFLHIAARKTWSFFETFVTAADNYLPPDNYQEEPVATLAHRTSPTNIGLALLANLTAYDFGYISAQQLLQLTKQTFTAMARLARFKGHFYNWYNTETLAPLLPRYVSTVDSGNLVGHLLTLKQGLICLSDQPIINKRSFEGIHTCAHVVQGHFKNDYTQLIGTIIQLSNFDPYTALLSASAIQLDKLVIAARALKEECNSSDDIAKNWIDRLLVQIEGIIIDFKQAVPWLDLLPAPEKFNLLTLDGATDYKSFHRVITDNLKIVGDYKNEALDNVEREWLEAITAALTQASTNEHKKNKALELLINQCEQFSTIDYDFLFDKTTGLLRIGYNVEEERKDDSFYDLLASEARLGIFVGIAQGKLPQESWFSLGRLLTKSGIDPTLLSWSGSMFEYLMPQLVMPAFENTLLDQTNKSTVRRQMDYAAEKGIPWGISESAYYGFDTALNYQYKAFGVPGLGLKRGLEEDLVIAPYASMLALMVLPEEACANLQVLSAAGFEGEFGFYEAIDYTANRIPRGKEHEIIKSFMVHHQGMGFLSLAYLLLNKPMQQRFNAELRFQATLLLLQERIPKATLFYAHTAELLEKSAPSATISLRTINTPHTAIPELQLLSNGKYQVMITNGGGGYSRWKQLSLNRWREDSVLDNYGNFCYIKDIASGKAWSNTFQPTLKEPDTYEALFSQGHVEFKRVDDDVETKTEIVVSPEDDIEIRRIRITNKANYSKDLEITSYTEVVIAEQAADEAHPAFSNLFVQTEILPEHKAIYCTRRPRSEDEVPPYIFHLFHVQNIETTATSYETDRMRFIGRGKSVSHPLALETENLSGTEGAVLDPVMAIRHRITLRPNQTAIVDLVYGIGDNRESCRALMHKYKDQHLRKRAIELSWTHSQVLLRQLNCTESDVQLFNLIASSIVFNNRNLRADESVIRNNYRSQSGLWSHSISGDYPIILLHVTDADNMELVRQLTQAHAYWKIKGLIVDLIICNEDHGSYRQVLQDQISGLVHAATGATVQQSKLGSIFIKSIDQVSPEDRTLFESLAKIIVYTNRGALTDQLAKQINEKKLPVKLIPQHHPVKYKPFSITTPDNLEFSNGRGGFCVEEQTYKIITDGEVSTPVPWVNILANPIFGTVVSETGAAYTWATNAHEYRITPWNNDTVNDICGEAFYLRDEDSGDFWSPAPFPVKTKSIYVTTHGLGLTKIEHAHTGIASSMCIHVHKNLPLKFMVFKFANHSGLLRRLSITGFMEIILGDVRSKSNMHILSERDVDTGALLFQNRYNASFANQVSFFAADQATSGFTTDRTEFIGRNKSLRNPESMLRKGLSARVGAGRDTCAALQSSFSLEDGESVEISFMLGSTDSSSQAINFVNQFLAKGAIKQSLQDVCSYWKEMVSSVQVKTPDAAVNIMTNSWLLYQTIACRLFARSGFYQSGGAFGFRDQLQDVLAVMHADPSLARQQILLHASRQFEQGDVQHWWHPPENRGVRTRCSDDLLWLPYVTCRYLETTDDLEILDVNSQFLNTRELHEGEDSLYEMPQVSELTASLYQHCVLSIKRSLVFGVHGLPLIGSGDWNDGMDKVGHSGKGESVWLAFFLYNVLINFEKVARTKQDTTFANTCIQEAEQLKKNIETNAWDGDWYLRAWFDDGQPIGSAQNDECRIDAIAQSWSVLSDAGNQERKEKAMASLNKYLVKRDMKLIRLLTPAFDKSALNPGYIKGYVPGVRENGGQYSHAAIWAIMAFAKMGDRDKVYELVSMLLPINHSKDVASREVYKVEPYVMAADVYANKTHEGRGGWTWYTGSAGWMYKLILESLIGLERKGDYLHFKPCYPLSWPSVQIHYRYRSSMYHITVAQVSSPDSSSWQSDEDSGKGSAFKLIDDGIEHNIAVQVLIK